MAEVEPQKQLRTIASDAKDLYERNSDGITSNGDATIEMLMGYSVK